MLPGVVVTITNTDTGAERSLVTNELGLFRAPAVATRQLPGDRGASGFQEVRAGNISLSVGATVVITATMDVGAVSETVEVSGHLRLSTSPVSTSVTR